MDGEIHDPVGADRRLNLVFIGRSISDAWSDDAATLRSLLHGLAGLGHDVLFLERTDAIFSLDNPVRTARYTSLEDLKRYFSDVVANADAVILSSRVADGVRIGEWVLGVAGGVAAFYDLDAPRTLAQLGDRGAMPGGRDDEYITPALLARFPLCLSTAGASVLERLTLHGAQDVLTLLPAVTMAASVPTEGEWRWDLGLSGAFEPALMPALETLLFNTARHWGGGRFAVSGRGYPAQLQWPANVERLDRPPGDFSQRRRFALCLRDGAIAPDQCLLEAAACGVPVITNSRAGLDPFFRAGSDVLVARSWRDVIEWLVDMPERDRLTIGRRARSRVLRSHTAARRAAELAGHVAQRLRMEPAA